jgi:hypothetical protein
MVNTLFAVCEEQPKIKVNLRYTYPIAEKNPKIAEAFRGEEPDWNFLRGVYGDKVYINPGKSFEWKEVSVSLNRPNLEESLKRAQRSGKIELYGGAIDSFTTQAMRKGEFSDSLWGEAGIFGFSLSSDNYLIFGTRGGSDCVGQIIPVPAGSVGYPAIKHEGRTRYVQRITLNPFGPANKLELREEAGILEEEISEDQLIGVFCQEPGSGATPYNFFYLNRLTIPAEEVLSRHKKAMQLYSAIKTWEVNPSDDFKEESARIGLESAASTNPKIPRDAWENERLEAFPNDPEKLRERVRIITESPELGKLKHAMSGCLALYYLKIFGEEEFEKLQNLPEISKNINLENLILI